jgi:hypothetical protein
MTARRIRSEIKLILTDLANKNIRFSGSQRFRLHERVAELQTELRTLEIERLEEEALQADESDGNPEDRHGDEPE